MRQRSAPPDEVAAFSALFDDAYLDVVRFVARRVPEADAEDVVAEAFAVAWRRFADAPADHDGRRAWLFGIARNCLLNARRAARQAARVLGISAGGYRLRLMRARRALRRALDVAPASSSPLTTSTPEAPL